MGFFVCMGVGGGVRVDECIPPVGMRSRLPLFCVALWSKGDKGSILL